MIFIITSFSAFFLSTALVGIVLFIATKKFWFDKIDDRKIHTGEVPRLGGVGFAVAYGIVVILLNIFVFEQEFSHRFLPLLATIAFVMIFGVVDDFKALDPKLKLFIQTIAAAVVVSVGYTFQGFSFADLGIFVRFGWLAYPITFLWIVGVTNAINFIDGVDGLAGGISAIAALCYAAIFMASGRIEAALLCVSLVAVIFGFLVFNAPFPKARLFMGDGGSQFLGFMLAILPLLDIGKGGLVLPLPYAAGVLLIPIFDTFAAIWRRVRDHKPIDSPDKEHLHHKLMNLGCGHRKVDAVLWSLQAIIGIMVYASVITNSWDSFWILFAAYLLLTIFFSAIHFLNVRKRKQNA